ncbi:MAG: phage holin family protein [Bacteroidetes bacterium]|nr:phage holin family protein [Bacteroidota bacterium]
MEVIKSAHEIKDNATDWLDAATTYLEARWNLGVLDLSEKSARAASHVVSLLILGTIGTIVLLFLSLGVAWLLGEWLHSPAKGFFLVGLFYGIVGLVLFWVKDKFIRVPVVNALIKQFYYEK